MSRRPEGMKRLAKNASWQEDAWKFYDEVGELRFGVGWLANGMSRVNLVAANQPRSLGDQPMVIMETDETDVDAEPLTEAEQSAHDLVSAIAGGPNGQGQLVSDIAVQLTIPGIGWVLMEAETVNRPNPLSPLALTVDRGVDDDDEVAPDETWKWYSLSNDEIRQSTELNAAGQHFYEVRVGEREWRPVAEDHVLVKIWKRHPRKGWEADSPCRAVLNVLRQIALLDEHVFATAQSRLAGAGILVVPNEVEFTVVIPSPIGDAPMIDLTEPQEDDFVDVLIDTMTTPIGDRSSAAAVVPLVIRVPGEYVDRVKHITFWSEFSNAILPLRESAIKRLALGLDMPPEVLLGLGGVNHWTAWQVEETAITLHIEPMAEVICHALTVGYLQPALRATGLTAEEAQEFMVWYDTTDLTTRPDRSADAVLLYDRMELSGDALRREAGLSEDDAPGEEELRARRLWKLAELDPTYASELLDMDIPSNPIEGIPESPDQPSEGVDGPPPEPAEITSSAAVLEACDALVYRALERAGGRLRSAAGKKVPGGASAIACDDVTQLHVMLAGNGSYASLDTLLEGAWNRVPTVAKRIGWHAEALQRTLDGYTRSLIATGNAHDTDRLAAALGLVAAS